MKGKSRKKYYTAFTPKTNVLNWMIIVQFHQLQRTGPGQNSSFRRVFEKFKGSNCYKIVGTGENGFKS
jgi:hypothetical protein